MSCGKHHDVDCQDVLRRVYLFIDQELADADYHEIRKHLDECAPCLHSVDMERLIKALVARSCTEQAPVELRQRVMFEIRQVSFDVSHRSLDLD
jgi:mycothiol system anti-sigma-R factor